jgi:hypothetical protein
MYIPPDCESLDKMGMQQIRLGIQGPPGTGKTWAALTFPNPIAANPDRGLGAHAGRADVIEIPFWRDDFCDKYAPRQNKTMPPNRRDAIRNWLYKEGKKLEASQTLVFDGLTGLQNAFATQQELEPVYTKTGKIDDFAFWNLKVKYFGEICELFKTLQCHVVFICHETPDRNKEGELNGKLRPLLTGQFADQLASHFTDWFRAHAFAKPTDYTKVKSEQWGMNLSEFQSMCESFTQCNTIYAWQTQSDDLANCKASSLVGAPRFIRADYTTFTKHMRRVN